MPGINGERCLPTGNEARPGIHPSAPEGHCQGSLARRAAWPPVTFMDGFLLPLSTWPKSEPACTTTGWEGLHKHPALPALRKGDQAERPGVCCARRQRNTFPAGAPVGHAWDPPHLPPPTSHLPPPTSHTHPLRASQTWLQALLPPGFQTGPPGGHYGDV